MHSTCERRVAMVSAPQNCFEDEVSPCPSNQLRIMVCFDEPRAGHVVGVHCLIYTPQSAY
jgi:hypothetical protein